MTSRKQNTPAAHQATDETAHTIDSWLGSIVGAHGSRPAVLHDEAVWSYNELWERSYSIAQGLLAHPNFGPRVRVGLVSRNSAQWVAAYFGILLAGGAVVTPNHLLRPRELIGHLHLADISGCLLGDVDGETREALIAECNAVPIQSVGSSGSQTLPAVAPDWDAVLLPTSGSTGKPKVVVTTHGAMVHGALQLARALPYSPDDVSIAFLPLFACAHEQVLPTLFSGAALDILPKFDPVTVSAACERATTFDAVPTVMARLLEHGDHDKLRRLRWVLFASEPMPPPLLRRWWDTMPEVRTYEFYGMSELLSISFATHECLHEDPTCVGVPFATAAVEIVDESGRRLPRGVTGEIVCRSPARMRGYFQDPAATRHALTENGGMRTGDLGFIDELGRLHLTGRLKDIIISGGFNVAPAEIEAVACQHPLVAAAAVVGVPHPRFGETPVVVAIPRRGSSLSAADLLQHCRSILSSYKRPSAAAVVAQFPQVGIGKSAKGELRNAILRNEIELVWTS